MFIAKTASAEMVVKTPAQVEDYIIWRAMEKGVPVKVALSIVRCEGGFGNVPNYAYDGEDGRYTAYGPFQILKSTAKRYSDLDRRIIKHNVEIGLDIYLTEGLTPWNESKSCWRRLI